jgi:hypothetical protein
VLVAADPISTDLVRIALDRVEGTPFERFGKDFYPAIAGRQLRAAGRRADATTACRGR